MIRRMMTTTSRVSRSGREGVTQVNLAGRFALAPGIQTFSLHNKDTSPHPDWTGLAEFLGLDLRWPSSEHVMES